MKFYDATPGGSSPQEFFELKEAIDDVLVAQEEAFQGKVDGFRDSVVDTFVDYDALHGEIAWMHFDLGSGIDTSAPEGQLFTMPREALIVMRMPRPGKYNSDWSLLDDDKAEFRPHIWLYLQEHMPWRAVLSQIVEINCTNALQYHCDAYGPFDKNPSYDKRHSDLSGATAFHAAADNELVMFRKNDEFPMLYISGKNEKVVPFGYSDCQEDREYALDFANYVLDLASDRVPDRRSTID